ncbi:MAG: Gfo/Idh/MocA family protein [Gemmataceae bacterium]
MVNIGIVGIGFMGMIHYLAAAKLGGSGQVTALCSRDRKKLGGDWRGIHGNFGPPGEMMDLGHVKKYERLDQLLGDRDIDLVDICNPTSLHPETAIKALRAGKHVLVEKPIALRTEDADAMVAAARQAGKLLMVGQVLPFFPEFAFAHQAILKKSYGKLLGAHFKRIIAKPDWSADIADPAKTGGPALDLHIHDTHFIRVICGMPEAVFATGIVDNGVVQYLTTQYLFGSSGPAVTCSSGAVACKDRPFVHGYEIYLEQATLVYESGTQPLTVLKADGGSEKPGNPDGDHLSGFIAELTQAITAIGTGRESELLGGQLARDALVLCHKECESVKTGKAVGLK